MTIKKQYYLFTKKAILFLLLALLSITCSVQKRKYQKGYYVSWNNHKTQKKSIGKIDGIQNKYEINTTYQTKLKEKIVANEPVLETSNHSLNTPANDSCDVIIFRDGSEISAKVIEISTTQIKYKRCDLQNGPLYTIKKSEVFMIKYEGGVREVFKEEAPASISPTKVPENYQVPKDSAPVNNPNKITHPKAIKGFVYGLISFLCFLAIGSTAGLLFFLLALITAITALVASIKASIAIRKYPNEFKGRGLAITGRVFSIITLSLFVLFVIILLSM